MQQENGWDGQTPGISDGGNMYDHNGNEFHKPQDPLTSGDNTRRLKQKKTKSRDRRWGNDTGGNNNAMVEN